MSGVVFHLISNEIGSIFPNLVRNSTNNLFITFTGETEGFRPLPINFQIENEDLIKRYYNRQINFYFRKVKKQIVKVGFVKENQAWLKSRFGVTALCDIYEKFSLKVQLRTVSKFPELVLSYDGQSKVSKQSVAQLIQSIITYYSGYIEIGIQARNSLDALLSHNFATYVADYRKRN